MSSRRGLESGQPSPSRSSHKPTRLTLTSGVEQQVSDVDKVIAVTGFRPDVTSLSEVRLDLDPVLSSTRALAAEIDPSFHSCGDVLPARVQRAHPT
jgi:hypothetical protein